MDIIQYRKEVKEARDFLILDAIQARPALDNIDLSNSLRTSISNRAIRSLKEELLLVITNCNKNLSDLSILEILKTALNNKKTEIEAKYKKGDKESVMKLKEELLLRILNDTKDVNNCFMRDVEYRRLINMPPDQMTRIDKLILRCQRARTDLSNLDLTDEMLIQLKNKDKLTIRDEMVLKLLTTDEDLATFDLQALMKKILHLKKQLAEKDAQLTKKQLKDEMLLSVLQNKISTKNMNKDYYHGSVIMSKRTKQLLELNKNQQKQIFIKHHYDGGKKLYVPKPGEMLYQY